MTEETPPSLPDLPLEQQVQGSISLALRLHGEGRTEDAKVIFEALGQQMRDAGPYALLIAGEKPGPPSLQALITLIQQCATEITEARSIDDARQSDPGQDEDK